MSCSLHLNGKNNLYLLYFLKSFLYNNFHRNKNRRVFQSYKEETWIGKNFIKIRQSISVTFLYKSISF